MLKKISLEKLLKLEIPLLTNRIIEIVEKNNPEALKIKESFDLLEKLQPQLINLEKRHGPHPITKKLNTFREQRLINAALITTQLSVYLKDDEADMRAAAELVQPIVKRFLNNLRNYNDDIITEHVDQFSRIILLSEELSTAVATLDLIKYLDKLQSINSILKIEWKKRSNLISERPNIYSPSLKNSLFGAIRNLFYQINQAQTHHLNIDYAPLVDELNNVLSFYRGKINSRISYNKKRKAESIINNPVIDNEFDESLDLTVGQIPNLNELDPATGVEIESFKVIDKEKVAAMSSNSSEKPFTSKTT